MDTPSPKTPSTKIMASPRTLPLVEERVEISKTAEFGDVLRVDLKTESYTEQVQTTLTSESAQVTRHAIDQVVDSVPDIRRDGNITIIPVVEERLVIRKEFVLVEEIHIERETQDRSVEESVTLRRQIPTISRMSSKTD